jgi:hypothetical protein
LKIYGAWKTLTRLRVSPGMRPRCAYGGWAESDDLGDEFVAEIYADRLKAVGREIDL